MITHVVILRLPEALVGPKGQRYELETLYRPDVVEPVSKITPMCSLLVTLAQVACAEANVKYFDLLGSVSAGGLIQCYIVISDAFHIKATARKLAQSVAAQLTFNPRLTKEEKPDYDEVVHSNAPYLCMLMKVRRWGVYTPMRFECNLLRMEHLSKPWVKKYKTVQEQPMRAFLTHFSKTRPAQPKLNYVAQSVDSEQQGPSDKVSPPYVSEAEVLLMRGGIFAAGDGERERWAKYIE